MENCETCITPDVPFRYKVKEIYTDNAVINRRTAFRGQAIAVMNIPAGVELYIRLDDENNDNIRLREGAKLETPGFFNQFYVTTVGTVAGEKVQFYVGNKPLSVSGESGGLATAAKQDTMISSLGSIDGKITACDTSGLALESGGNLDTIAGDTTSIDGKITACDTTNLATNANLQIAWEKVTGVSAPGGGGMSIADNVILLKQVTGEGIPGGSGKSLANILTQLVTIAGGKNLNGIDVAIKKITGESTPGGSGQSLKDTIEKITGVAAPGGSGKSIADVVTDTTSIDGKITACDTSGLALESGGNLDTIAGDTTSIDGKTIALPTGINEYQLTGSGEQSQALPANTREIIVTTNKASGNIAFGFSTGSGNYGCNLTFDQSITIRNGNLSSKTIYCTGLGSDILFVTALA